MDQIAREADTPPQPDALPLPDWLPRTPGVVELLPCGEWWDAVRAPARIGAIAMEMLAGRSGPVLSSPLDSTMFWFITKGSAVRWDLPCTIEVWGTACYVSVPSPTPGTPRYMNWLTPPKGDCLTDAIELRDALAAAVAALAAPRPETGR
jgi:hypothetical protein